MKCAKNGMPMLKKEGGVWLRHKSAQTDRKTDRVTLIQPNKFALSHGKTSMCQI